MYLYTYIYIYIYVGEIDETCLKELWAEALLSRTNKNLDININDKKGFKNTDSIDNSLDFDAFVRMNVRLGETLLYLNEYLYVCIYLYL
jgi:hypothetical protein